jgi:hypothetical protein
MKCPNYSHENREGAEFCGECGQSLRPEVFYSQCGHVNTPTNKFCDKCGHPLAEPAAPTLAPTPSTSSSPEPTSFANSRYQVKRLLGEGGKKKVHLAHDTRLGRDIAFALIKAEGLDEEARARIERKAQATGRLGNHPSIVAVYDFGEHEGQPWGQGVEPAETITLTVIVK